MLTRLGQHSNKISFVEKIVAHIRRCWRLLMSLIKRKDF